MTAAPPLRPCGRLATGSLRCASPNPTFDWAPADVMTNVLLEGLLFGLVSA